MSVDCGGGLLVALGDDWSTGLAKRVEELRGEDAAEGASGLASFRQSATEKLQTQRLPSTRDEPFRFTNVAFLKDVELVAPTPPEPLAVPESDVDESQEEEEEEEGTLLLTDSAVLACHSLL